MSLVDFQIFITNIAAVSVTSTILLVINSYLFDKEELKYNSGQGVLELLAFPTLLLLKNSLDLWYSFKEVEE